MIPEPADTVMLAAGQRDGADLPWWAKIILKMILTRLPVPRAWWRRIGVFRHGCLADDVERRGADFLGHVARYRALAAAPPRRIVEIGPGDSVAGALWAKAHGADETWLIDVGRFALEDPAHYRAVIGCIARHGLDPPVLAPPGGIASVLTASGAVYRTDGLSAFAALPDESIDFVFSQAVLEHLPLGQFDRFLGESFRVLRPGGVSSHMIDLRDHLGGALNHLRFSRRFWEWSAVSRSGFYTNRLSYSQICRIAEEAGFIVSTAHLLRWSALPTPRSALDREFQALPDEELAIAGFTLVLQKPQRTTTAAGAS
ncbi:MAG: methyltransferase domain-containing protein [Stellaceae bacterium]